MLGIKRSDETRKKCSDAAKERIKNGAVTTKGLRSPEATAKVREKNRIRNKENPPNKGRIWISKDGIKKMIFPATFNEYKEAGWSKGYKN